MEVAIKYAAALTSTRSRRGQGQTKREPHSRRCRLPTATFLPAMPLLEAIWKRGERCVRKPVAASSHGYTTLYVVLLPNYAAAQDHAELWGS